MPVVNIGTYYGQREKGVCWCKDDPSNMSAYTDSHIWGPASVWRLMISGGVGANSAGQAALKFDFSSIPTGSIVNSATLYHYYLYGTGDSFVISVRRLKYSWGMTDWDAGGDTVINPASGGRPSGNYRFATTTAWSGGAFNVANDAYAAEDATLSVPTPSNGTWYNQSATNLVKRWITEGADNDGYVYNMDSGSLSQTQDYFSHRDPSNVNLNPYFVIDYTPHNIFMGMDF